MGREHDVGAVLADRRNHLLDRRRNKSLLGTGCELTRLQHHRLDRDAAHVEDLCPAVAEPAVAQHQHFLAGRELTRHRLHAEGAATGDDGNGLSLVDLLQHR